MRGKGQATSPSAILIAGVGNELRADDGVGLVVARRLLSSAVPPNAIVREYGINGIALVQDLQSFQDAEGLSALIILDASRSGGVPGDVHVLQCTVPALAEMEEQARRDFLADVHWTNPNRALVLAQGLGVLPPRVFLVGIEPVVTDDLAMTLTAPVLRAVDKAVAAVCLLVDKVASGATGATTPPLLPEKSPATRVPL